MGINEGSDPGMCCWMSKVLLSPELRVWPCAVQAYAALLVPLLPWGLIGDSDMAAGVEALGITWECFCDTGEQVRLGGHENPKSEFVPQNDFSAINLSGPKQVCLLF